MPINSPRGLIVPIFEPYDSLQVVYEQRLSTQEEEHNWSVPPLVQSFFFFLRLIVELAGFCDRMLLDLACIAWTLAWYTGKEKGREKMVADINIYIYITHTYDIYIYMIYIYIWYIYIYDIYIYIYIYVSYIYI